MLDTPGMFEVGRKVVLKRNVSDMGKIVYAGTVGELVSKERAQEEHLWEKGVVEGADAMVRFERAPFSNCQTPFTIAITLSKETTKLELSDFLEATDV